MFKDRIILVENMDISNAICEVKSLPNITEKEDRHKFVFTQNRAMVIGRSDTGNPRHMELGNINVDKIAGYICFTINEDDEVTHVYMNNQSKDFDYPKFEYLKEPQIFITKLFGPICVDMEDIPKPNNHVIELSSLTTH